MGLVDKDGRDIMPGGGKVSGREFGSAHRNSAVARENGINMPLLPSILKFCEENFDVRTLCCLGEKLLAMYMDFGYYPIAYSTPPQGLEIRNAADEGAAYFLVRGASHMDLKDIRPLLMRFDDAFKQAVPVLELVAGMHSLETVRKKFLAGELKRQRNELLKEVGK